VRTIAGREPRNTKVPKYVAGEYMGGARWYLVKMLRAPEKEKNRKGTFEVRGEKKKKRHRTERGEVWFSTASFGMGGEENREKRIICPTSGGGKKKTNGKKKIEKVSPIGIGESKKKPV